MGRIEHGLRQRHSAQELAAAALRAIAGRRSVHFERGRIYDDDRLLPVYAPHLRLTPGSDTLAAYRGVADSMALRLVFSDPALHALHVPQAPMERFLFEWLEQLRVESLVPDFLPGARHNLFSRYRLWSETFMDSGSTETSLGILLFAFSQIVWSRLTGRELPEAIQDLLEPTRAALAPALGGAFVGIRRYRRDQSRFAPYALEIARDIAQRVQSEYQDSPETLAARHGTFTLSLDIEQDDQDAYPDVQTGESAIFIADQRRYRIFTRRYDQERHASDLVRAAVLHEYRERLDRRIAQQGMNVARLARALATVLAQPRTDSWRFGQEEGVIDGRRLALLVSSPGERRLFRRDHITPVADCAISFLIDCSGSMKQHMETIAVMVDIVTRALEQAGAATEILGFTTSSWNGGRPAQTWVRQGRPPAPGRLNEVCHLVFKTASVGYRRARRSLAALLKADLFREGIDGEAVQWACERLLARNEPRRVLVVVSDGCPMDSATNLANDAYYLDNHLKSVVAHYTARHGVDIIGVGVGLDLTPYYPRSLSLDLSQGLDNRVFGQFVQLLMGRYRR